MFEGGNIFEMQSDKTAILKRVNEFRLGVLHFYDCYDLILIFGWVRTFGSWAGIL